MGHRARRERCTAGRRWPARLSATLIAAVVAAGCGAEPPPPTAEVPPTTTRAPLVIHRVTTTIATEPVTVVEEPGSTMAVPTVDTAGATSTVAVAPVVDLGAPPVVARPVPPQTTLPPFSFVSPWADATRSSPGGGTSVDLGCAEGLDAGALDRFFAERLGPLLGEDYQHVYPLAGDRYLWLFQDAFVDHTGLAQRLDEAGFVHNLAIVQTGTCFTMFHGGTINAPTSFERGTGEQRLTRWFWPMGGELTDQGMQVFWVEMLKDADDPGLGDGLGWHPGSTFLATYDPDTLARRSFVPAADPGATPIYGFAVASDDEYTYLFGNTFEQNLLREGGFGAGPHSATVMTLARVPRGRLDATPEYRTADGWSADRTAAAAISSRYWVENPMQPRFVDGVWVAATKVDGYWGERLAIDVAEHPWGPWQNVETVKVGPRDDDRLMNTYHAHLLPWRDAEGNLIVVISQNARDMVTDAFPVPARYRPRVFTTTWSTPTPPTTTTTAAPPSAPPTAAPTTPPAPDTTVESTMPATVDPTTTLPDATSSSVAAETTSSPPGTEPTTSGA